MTSTATRTLLFVCTGNTCRSPMAERLMAKLCRPFPQWRFASAGLFAAPGAPASEMAIEVMREIGISLEDHRSRVLSPAMVKEADLLIAMTSAHRDGILAMAPDAAAKTHTLHSFGVANPGLDVMDPFRGVAETYRRVRDEIESALADVIISVISPSSPTPERKDKGI